MISARRGAKAEIGCIDLLEEATHLLRRAPLFAWVVYCVCSLPFVLGALFFVADMSRGAHAWEHLSGAAFGMVLLFTIMKVGQAIFCDQLLHQLNDESNQLALSRLPRVFYSQLAVQSFGLFILPVAAILTLPFGWSFALFQNFTVFGQGRKPLRQEISIAWQQAQTWPGQNHLTIVLLSLFWIMLIPAIAATLYLLPHLLHMLFGVDSIFVQSNQHMLNTTFWAVVFLVSMLLLDPLVKSVYVLRCFYGVSLSSGADLRVDLRRIQKSAVRLLICGLVLSSFMIGNPGQISAGEDSVAPHEIRQAVSAEMNSARYEWRQPRVEVPENQEPGFLAPLGDAILDGLRWLGKQFQSLLVWIEDLLQSLMPDIEPNSSTSPSFLREADPLLLALYLLCALGLCLAGIWIYRFWRRRRRAEKPAVEQVIVLPDLESEEVSADELPADRWTALAHDLLAKGEIRLALRALILGALARLADDGYLKLSRSKSNRDYLSEIAQRGQELVDVKTALADNITIMEGVWYGDHTVDPQGVKSFLAHHERIMRYGHSV
jgi:hypothetical protein